MRIRGKPRPVVLISIADILKRDLANGLISPAQASEQESNKEEFERHRTTNERRFSGRYVAYAGGTRYVGNSVAEVLSQVQAVDATLLVYIEQIA
jgi:hypothetical protein